MNTPVEQLPDDLASALALLAEERARRVAAEAEAALERAREQRRGAKDAVTISEAEAMINRAQVRIKVAGLRRRKH